MSWRSFLPGISDPATGILSSMREYCPLNQVVFEIVDIQIVSNRAKSIKIQSMNGLVHQSFNLTIHWLTISIALLPRSTPLPTPPTHHWLFHDGGSSIPPRRTRSGEDKNVKCIHGPRWVMVLHSCCADCCCFFASPPFRTLPSQQQCRSLIFAQPSNAKREGEGGMKHESWI